jgi:signal transduction histidine kinase/integral membrane sensor domain MASE1
LTADLTGQSWRHVLLHNLAVGAAYWIAGRLGLLLAIPPGYATAVWPPSGFALAGILLWGYRALPGVWLGSFLINIGTSLDASSWDTFVESLLVPAAIASGATLQAALGTFLIRRFVGYTNLLVQELEVVWILVLGGPVACLVNASTGVGALTLRGLVPLDSALFNWWTWWVGDSIGVLVFTPLVLVWTARPLVVWRGRQVMASLPLVVVFAAVVWLFVVASNREEQRLRSEFRGWSMDFAEAVDADLRSNTGALYNLQAFYTSLGRMDPQQFKIFAEQLLRHRPGVQALEWSPVVEARDRQSFEQRVRAEGQPGFTITDRDAAGNIVPAALAVEYVPVEFVVPLQGNEAAVGYNGASELNRVIAISAARDKGEPAASARVHLVQETQGHFGLLIFAPCYARGLASNTVEDRRLAIRGYVEAVFRMPDLIQSSLDTIEGRGLKIELRDLDAPLDQELLYRTADSPHANPADWVSASDIDVGGRHWRVQVTMPAQYLTAHKSWETWTLLAAGMLFTGLLGMFMLVVIGRAARLDELVARRTAELAESNRDLEQFAYVASHDLQAPLRSVASFATLLERRYKDRLGNDANQFLAAIRESVGDMRDLIDDLLALSRANAGNLDLATVPLQEVVAKACQQLAADIKTAGARVDYAGLPRVRGDSRMLTQVFQNLIANAIKFQRPGATPIARISARRQGTEWWISVQDNGIGIDKEHQEAVFLMFKRLHAADAYPGTGVGLALCRKIVQLHQGRLWVESTPGEGSTFIVALPVDGGVSAGRVGVEGR